MVLQCSATKKQAKNTHIEGGKARLQFLKFDNRKGKEDTHLFFIQYLSRDGSLFVR